VNKLSLLIIDDHTLFRSGIIALLRRYEEFVLVGETGDPMAGVKLARTFDPDVILLDLHMPNISGVDVLKVFAAEKIRAQVLMLTVSEDGDDVINALCAGARGYLLKNINTESLVAAIRQAAKGKTVVCPEMASKLVEGVRNPQRKVISDCENPLSPREREILTHIARGDSNKEIAQLLNLADSTVKIHVQNIFKKLNITSRVQAAVYAIDHGFR
jgi:two-component system nitrate/nitrite response regulator NarL